MSTRAAIRYAKAVLDQANEGNISEVVFGDMNSVAETLEASKELRNVLQSPIINGEDKKQALTTIFKDNSEVTKGLIEVLTANKRINLLGGVASSYISLYNENKGIKVAEVTTAVALSSVLEKEVLSKVKDLTGSDQITINNIIDESIIGGFVLRVGDIQYNASISNQLANIKREFLSK